MYTKLLCFLKRHTYTNIIELRVFTDVYSPRIRFRSVENCPDNISFRIYRNYPWAGNNLRIAVMLQDIDLKHQYTIRHGTCITW